MSFGAKYSALNLPSVTADNTAIRYCKAKNSVSSVFMIVRQQYNFTTYKIF